MKTKSAALALPALYALPTLFALPTLLALPAFLAFSGICFLSVLQPFSPSAFSADALSAAVPPPSPGFTCIRSGGGFTEYRLDSNGLQILLMPEHSSPTLTFMVTYRVGSRNEVTGATGATHLLEHLMFKGTKKFNRDLGLSLDQQIDKVGGANNATTWFDRTNYYEILGSDHLALAADIEADRMRNLLLREEDRRPEMTVVRNEFERGENDPFNALMKEIFQSAYVAYPYHHDTIGWLSDIENVPIEKLREFYDTYYWPDNATVTIIGDFKTGDALDIIRKYFAPIPRAPHPIPQLHTTEPAQTGPRRVTIKRAGELGVVGIAYKTPETRHPDFPALKVLSMILTNGKNSRFYRALTDKNLTVGADSLLEYTAAPALMILFAPLAPGATHADTEKAALAEIERVKKDGVTAAEVAAAVAKYLADSAYQRDGSFAIAGNINECIAAGDWTLYHDMADAIKKTTPADIQRVAQKYLQEDQSTTGWFIPLAPQE
ncbi:MAG: insulinase family protein [Opitutaceae bacterium]|jgi:zinc protease|nr:insulinase family protein [Opitutaceae bacterium]